MKTASQKTAAQAAPSIEIPTATAGDPNRIVPPPTGAETSNGVTFERADWTLFRTIPGVCQKAGVSPERLRRCVYKEIVDNALDVSDDVEIQDAIGPAGWGMLVRNSGDGIPGTDDEIAELFSIKRPLRSTKLLRLPTRGALGNGLRVVAGAVLASGGSLVVRTRGRELHLQPQDDGSTAITKRAKWSGTGTEIEVVLGDAVPADRGAFTFASNALQFIGADKYAAGRTCAAWYDPAAFFELAQAAGSTSVRALVESFEGFSGAKAGRVVGAIGLLNRTAASLTRAEAAKLHGTLIDGATRDVKPSRLGRIGRRDAPGYSKMEDTFEIGGAAVPVVIEVWAEVKTDGKPSAQFYVNRSPILAQVYTWKEGTDCVIAGCGLRRELKVGRAVPHVEVNIQTPYMPITSDGKEPNLGAFGDYLEELIGRAINGAKRASGSLSDQVSQKEIIIDALPDAIEKTSGNGSFEFSQRQLFYAVRPALLEELDREPAYAYFCQVLTEYEAEEGEIEGMYRDDRGTLYHPHAGELIPLGTRSVAGYERPTFTFNKILYIEKEGFFEMLRAAKWPERHDCALLTSKGQPTRAARDLLDALGETDEEIQFFCVHDADAAGTIIYQSLQEATRARPGRTVHVVNLGLEPQEALELELQVENPEASERRRPVAGYVEPRWRDWLQEHRVELNAMTAPQFVAWLDAKMTKHATTGKVVPPGAVLGEELRAEVERVTREEISRRILEEAGADAQVAARVADLESAIPGEDDLEEQITDAVTGDPVLHWKDPIQELAVEIAGSEEATP